MTCKAHRIRWPSYLTRQDALRRGDLCLVTPYSPSTGFSVRVAMGRNRFIYTLADYAIIVTSNVETCGMLAGATDTLKNGWVPIFVLEHEQMPEGNKLLLQKRALPFPHPFREKPVKLQDWLKNKASNLPTRPEQGQSRSPAQSGFGVSEACQGISYAVAGELADQPEPPRFIVGE